MKKMYEMVTKTELRTRSWGSGDVEKKDLQELSKRELLFWLEDEYGQIFNPTFTWLTDITRLYDNDREKIVEKRAEISFQYRKYIGPEFGMVKVYQIVLGPQPNYYENRKEWNVWQDTIKEGYRFINTFLPDAVHRVGCKCCSGDGPDMDIKMIKNEFGSFIIEYYVDFEFTLSDDSDE